MYNVLVVDDEPMTREYLTAQIPLLSKHWHVEAEAMDGLEALEAMQNRQIDLIITDIKMPVMDGIELCREVAAQFPGKKVMILSGYDEFTMAKEALRYGVREYLLKPLVKEELQAALDRISQELEHEKTKASFLQTLKHLSEDSKTMVTKNFLRALITDSNAEIKALYPLI